MVVNSELEAHRLLPRAPARHRPLPLLGVGRHVPRSAASDGPADARSTSATSARRCPQPAAVNGISMIPLYDAALHHVQEWLTTGDGRHRSQPLIEFAGDPPDVVRDEHGIARGGIRLPQADVPIAQNSAIPVGTDIFSLLYGSCGPFPAEEVRRLYGGRDSVPVPLRGSGASRGEDRGAAAPGRHGARRRGSRRLSRRRRLARRPSIGCACSGAAALSTTTTPITTQQGSSETSARAAGRSAVRSGPGRITSVRSGRPGRSRR